MSWERIHYDNAQSIIRLFVAGNLDTLQTTLALLGERLELPIESIRPEVTLADQDDNRLAVRRRRGDRRRPAVRAPCRLGPVLGDPHRHLGRRRRLIYRR